MTAAEPSAPRTDVDPTVEGHRMHQLNLPAGTPIHLTATARPGVDLHRWQMLLFTAGDDTPRAAPRVTYTSQIGRQDRTQRIEAPAQDVDCRVELSSSHAVADGWRDDRIAIEHDDPELLRLGFCDPSLAGAMPDDISLRLAFDSPGAVVGRGA